MSKPSRRHFTDEFKQQMVQLYLSGKPRKDILHEYDLVLSAFARWLQQYKKVVRFISKIIERLKKMSSFNFVKKFNNFEWKMIF